MALTQTTLTKTYYKPTVIGRKLTADEAGSGIVYLQLDNGVTPTLDHFTFATVDSGSGVVRVLTNKFYDTTTGQVVITGTSFAENDIVAVMGVKFA